MVRTHRWVFAGIVALVLLITAQASFASTVWPLREGHTGFEVRVVQTRLCTLGYLASEPQEPYRFDTLTKKAVMKFQTASGLTVNGTVDEITYDRVRQSTAVTYDQYKDQMHVKGGSGEEVKETETRLKKLGYFTGTPNETYDDNTVESVSSFQRVHELAVTGKADAATRALLFSDKAMTIAEYRKIANLIPLKKGDSGDSVRVLQTQLEGLGYYADPVTGNYTVTTVASVKVFQTANGLKSTGKADLTTREILNSSSAKSFDVYTAESKLATVSRGDAGYAVQLMQSRLKELRYYGGAINGKCAATTVTAVKNFQKGNGLTVSGVANADTRAVMNGAGALDRVAALGLAQGDNLPEVSDMTTRLKQLGYVKAVSSKYTAAVTTAVKQFQTANKLSATGAADPETLDAMNSGDAVTFDEFKNGSGNAKIEKMIQEAYKHLGKPYKTGSDCNVPKSFDCSRFTAYVFKKFGVSMSGEVYAQGANMGKKYGMITSLNDLKRGDLLFFDTQTDKKIGHAAIFLGKSNGLNKFIHASSSAGKVVVTEFHDWYIQRFLFGVRVWK